MAYKVTYYGLDSWDVEETREFHDIGEASLRANGRAYAITVVPDAHVRAAMNVAVMDSVKMAAEAIALGLFLTGMWMWVIGR